jgi:hypothetical protein
MRLFTIMDIDVLVEQTFGDIGRRLVIAIIRRRRRRCIGRGWRNAKILKNLASHCSVRRGQLHHPTSLSRAGATSE